MTYKAEILTSSFVVVGDFNPAIFSPIWLERNKLIGEGDAAKALEGSEGRQCLISHQISNFETDWFTLQVVENQFTLTSRGALSPALKDLAVGIFQLVSHTPVSAIGLNFTGHFKLASQKHYHEVGDLLAPKDIWDTLYPDASAGLELLTIRIQQGTRDKPADTKDEKRITLQPFRSFKYGISLSFNDHHDVATVDVNELTSAEQVATIIDEQWEDAWEDALRVFDQVLSMAAKE